MGVVDLKGVTARLRNIAKTVPAQRVGAVARAAMFDGAGAIIALTPVDEGVLRGGWDGSTDAPSKFVPTAPRSTEDVLTQAAAAFASGPAFGRFWFTNNVVYAHVWELGIFKPPDPGPTKNKKKLGQVLVRGGYNTQAPAGFLRAGRAAVLLRLREATALSKGIR